MERSLFNHRLVPGEGDNLTTTALRNCVRLRHFLPGRDKKASCEN